MEITRLQAPKPNGHLTSAGVQRLKSAGGASNAMVQAKDGRLAVRNGRSTLGRARLIKGRPKVSRMPMVGFVPTRLLPGPNVLVVRTPKSR